MRPLRIDAHNGAPVWGGAEIATARLLAGLARRGHDVLLHCNDPAVARGAAALGVPTRLRHLGGDIAVHHALAFARDLRRRGPDALIIGTFRKSWLAALAGRLAGVPRIVARIGLETDTPRSGKYRLVYRRWVDAVVFNAESMRSGFAEALPAVADRTVTIHTGLPSTGGSEVEGPAAPEGRERGGAFRRELGVPEAAPLIGSVGRLATQKRYDRLVRLVAALPAVHGVVVGEGPERAALAALAREAGVAGRLHLPGHRDDVTPALAALDLFVLCSDREGMSNAMLEALHAGVPVVSTDVSGAREALGPGPDDEVPGRIVRDEAALVETVRALLADGAARRAMGRAARRVARQRFDEDTMLDAWERVLRGDDEAE